MTELHERLQAALGDAYRLEKELGGGGMSRVFLAEETRLGRRVVVKVLPPEMGAGVNVDRFEREIQLAARLQHPHVVPLLTAGAEGDLLWYIMPYIGGESLRAKLAREGELPFPVTLKVVREVLDALAYAHRQGVVHRDIKPDNILLSEGHALVTDFGVAKAVSESTGESSLTSLGVALGTPAYMSPEQAAASPQVDHRADIYAVGALMYEMLCGRPPFAGPNVQAVLSAHVTQAPDPPTKYRDTIPDALNQLVLRCLAKHPADRPQKAEELLPHIEAMLTPSGGTTPTGTQPVPAVDYQAVARQAHPVRVAVLFGVAAAVVLALVYGAISLIGLPNWVFLGAVILLAIGLPIMVLTGHHERRRALERTAASSQALATQSGGLKRHFTWRRALLGGGLAFAGLAVVTAGFMAMRVLGIGPVGTLQATGALPEESRVVLADFVNRSSDPTLGTTLTEALRVDLSQSNAIRLMDGASIAQALQRMGRDPTTRPDQALAMEIAEREGGAAVVVGAIGPLGRAYVLSVRLLSADNGAELFSQRETANTDAELIGAVDALSGRLRERIGESLRSIRARPRLAQVTTSSLDALRKYTAHLAADDFNEMPRAIALLKEALAIDSTFAMAWRRLAVMYSNTDARMSLEVDAVRRAYQLRDRLSERERHQVTAYYHTTVRNWEAAVAAYGELLARWPDDRTARNNIGIALYTLRREAAAESVLTATVEDIPDMTNGYINLVWAHVVQGKFAAAESTHARFRRQYGDDHSVNDALEWFIAIGRRDFDTGERASRAMLATPGAEGFGALGLVASAATRGRFSDAERHVEQYVRSVDGRSDATVQLAIGIATAELLSGKQGAAERRVASALARVPIATLDPLDRPYLELADFYAHAGRTQQARGTLGELDRALASFEATLRHRSEQPGLGREFVEGRIALAENRPRDALVTLRAGAAIGNCQQCGLVDIGRAFEMLGQPDSALAAYQAAVSLPGNAEEVVNLGPTYQRLGELYEARGERQNAIDFYNRFVELWADADPDLQPRVREVRQRIAQLVGER